VWVRVGRLITHLSVGAKMGPGRGVGEGYLLAQCNATNAGIQVLKCSSRAEGGEGGEEAAFG
jgi:hypothetical protein